MASRSPPSTTEQGVEPEATAREIQACAGGEHTLLKDSIGRIFSSGACGLGWCRRLPISSDLFGWRSVSMAEPARKLIAGYYHNLAIGQRTGLVYSWGCGTFTEGKLEGSIPAFGQGPDAKDDGSHPKLVKGSSHPAIDAAAGAYHSVVWARSGDVLTFGAAQLGQLGRETGGVKDGSGLPVDMTPKPVEGLPDARTDPVTSVGAGFYNTLVTVASGALYCSGENQNSQCGEKARSGSNLRKLARVMASGLDNEQIVKAVGGYCHTLALTRGGRVLTLGCSEDGQRGDGLTGEEIERPIVSEAKLYDTTDTNGSPSNGKAGTKLRAVEIAAGANHSVVLAEGGKVFAFGSNEYGQCGTCLNTHINEDGEDERGPIFTPTLIRLPSEAGTITSVTAGYSHTVLQDEQGKVFTFGQNDNGQLGLGAQHAANPRDMVKPQRAYPLLVE